MTAPAIANAPGLKWTKVKLGWTARWRPRGDLVEKGFKVESLRLWTSTKAMPEPDELTKTYIADRCQSLQADMLAWAHGGAPVLPATYDATWAGLVTQYKTDPDSPYHSKRFATRQHYDTLCRRVEKDMGAERIDTTNTRRLKRLHESWIAPYAHIPDSQPKVSMGHAMIGMLRTLTTFGATILECRDCRAIRPDLKDMRISAGKPRDAALSAEQATLIRQTARAECPSIALAQALQFDLALRQKDVIGEWVPMEEKGPLSTTTNGDEKWIRGLRWEEIDAGLVLRHVTSKRQKAITFDLHWAPMVMEEFCLMTGRATVIREDLPKSGPIVVNGSTGFPWHNAMFRRTWRELARKCGIPDNVRNMDTRAGAATEATAAGAPIEHVKHLMTHSDIAMTQRYARGDEAKVEGVMKSRVAHRNKTGTEG